jgi:hypothetical protein
MTPAVVNAEPVSEGSLEPLCSELRYAGHTLQQVFREKSIAIYARALPDREPHEFELVAIQRRPESTTPSGTQVPEREGYPSNSEWGKCAWSFPIRERDFVFGLATRMAAMDGPYGAWARNQVSMHGRLACAAVILPFAGAGCGMMSAPLLPSVGRRVP